MVKAAGEVNLSKPKTWAACDSPNMGMNEAEAVGQTETEVLDNASWERMA